MTRLGVDYSVSRPGAAALKAAGFTFVCRYLAGRTPGKALTQAEADELRAAGIDLVSNWEVAAQAALNGRAQGVADAKAAAAAHAAAGGPPGRPIYFSADWDATSAQQAQINAYFQGIASVIGLARTGAYGGYWVIKRLFDAGLIRWGWQTYAWSGGHWDPRAQLRQVQNGIHVAGQDADKDEAEALDFGQWGSPPPSEDDMDKDTEFYIPATPTTADITRQKDGGIRFADLMGWVVAVLDDVRRAAPAAAPVELSDAQLQTVADKVAAQLGGKLDTLLARLTAAGDALDG